MGFTTAAADALQATITTMYFISDNEVSSYSSIFVQPLTMKKEQAKQDKDKLQLIFLTITDYKMCVVFTIKS